MIDLGWLSLFLVIGNRSSILGYVLLGLEEGRECAVLNRHWAAGLTTAMGGTTTGSTTKAMVDMMTMWTTTATSGTMTRHDKGNRQHDNAARRWQRAAQQRQGAAQRWAAWRQQRAARQRAARRWRQAAGQDYQQRCVPRFGPHAM